nr:hypothetical protein [Sinorhizobium meliloti]
MNFEYHSPKLHDAALVFSRIRARFIGRRVDAKGNFLDDLPVPVIGFRPDMREILDRIVERERYEQPTFPLLIETAR